MLLKRQKNLSSINSFQDIFLDGHSVRETINGGERSFSDFRKLLDQAAKFKNWMGGINPDAKLIEEYHKTSISGTWAYSLPIKTLRFAICTFLGFNGDGTGLVAGGVDTFLLDKILKGWRPHHFVQGNLKKFVDVEED